MNSVIEMKKKRNNTIKIIGIGLGILVLYLGVSFYFQWSEGAPKIRYKSEMKQYEERLAILEMIWARPPKTTRTTGLPVFSNSSTYQHIKNE